MNALAIVPFALTVSIPLALLYRAVNPIPPKEKPPEKRKIGAIYHCDIRLMQEAWAGRPAGEMTAHYNREAALDAVQIAEDARLKAIRDAEIARQKAFEATPVGRIIRGAQTTVYWAFCGPIVLAIALVILSPFIFLLGLPVVLIVAALGFKFCLFMALIWWCISDFQNGVANSVVEKLKKNN